MSQVLFKPDKCEACLSCQLACTIHHDKNFNPLKARIVIKEIDEKQVMNFTSECVKDYYCVLHCPYGALTLKKQGE